MIESFNAVKFLLFVDDECKLWKLADAKTLQSLEVLQLSE
jgi:hypothetical protein